MKLPIKRALTYYLDSWWLPPLMTLVWVAILNFTFIITYAPPRNPLEANISAFLDSLWYVTCALIFVSSLSLLGSWGWLLFRKRWLRALLSFVLTLLGFVLYSHISEMIVIVVCYISNYRIS